MAGTESPRSERASIFPGLRPAADTSAAQWAVDAVARRGGVGVYVPGGYDAIRRVLVPVPGGHRWADRFPGYLGDGSDVDLFDWPPFPHHDPRGEPIPQIQAIDALLPYLAAATGTPQGGHYGVWRGGGYWDVRPQSVRVATTDPTITAAELAARRAAAQAEHVARMQPVVAAVERCPVVDANGFELFLLDGPVGGISIRPGVRLVPYWWWPDDRAWFVHVHVDFPCVYVAGRRELLDAIASDPVLESVEVGPDDRW